MHFTCSNELLVFYFGFENCRICTIGFVLEFTVWIVTFHTWLTELSLFSTFFIHSWLHYLWMYRKSSLLSALLKVYNVVSWPEGAAISIYTLILPLTYAVYPLSVHCECALMHKEWRIFNCLYFRNSFLTQVYCPFRGQKSFCLLVLSPLNYAHVNRWISLIISFTKFKTKLETIHFTFCWESMHWSRWNI